MALSLTVGHTHVGPRDMSPVAELRARADQLRYARQRRRRGA